MIDKKTTEYLEGLGKISLSDDAKVRMREELSSFADFHAVRISDETRSITQVQSNSVFTLFRNSQLRIMKATLLIALMVGMGGTSLAAQGTVPGDFLYPVKVHVNENVQSAFAVGVNAEAKLQAELLAERLAEAQKLAAEGKLQGELAAEVHTGIAAQARESLAASAHADLATKAEVKIEIQNALAAFTTNLHAKASTAADTNVAAQFGAEVNTYVGNLLNAAGETALGIELAGDINVETIVDGAQDRLAALKATIEAASDMSAEAQTDFKAKLEAAATYVSEAQAHLRANAEAQAEASAQQAHEILGSIESALSLLGEITIDENTGHIIDIDINSSTEAGAETSGDADSGVHLQTETILESSSDASLRNDTIDVQAGADAAAAAVSNIQL